MRVKPLSRSWRRRPVALIADASPGRLTVATSYGEFRHVQTMAGCGDYLRRSLDGFDVYAMTHPTNLARSTGAQWWTGYRWSGAIVTMKLDGGPSVRFLRRVFSDVNPLDAMAALVLVLDHLADLGVRPGGLSSMAYNLWRSTLTRTVDLRGPRVPARAALYGGRQECRVPGEYAKADYFDLGAAYPHSMAAEPYPTRLRPVPASTDYSEGAGLAFATVLVDEAPWGPLPARVDRESVTYGWGRLRGWWPWRELAMARDLGARVLVHQSWAPMSERDLFGPWWALGQELRRLPGAGAVLAKALTSSLWGSFALTSGARARVRWVDAMARRPIIVPEGPPRRLPHEEACYIASDTTSRVRCRLYREGLTLPGAVYADTDAVISDRGASPSPTGANPGQWRPKLDRCRIIDVRGPQVLRWSCHTCGLDHREWHYVVAGARSRDVAERVFKRDYTRRTVFARLGPGGTTLPAQYIDQTTTQEKKD